MKAMGDRQDIDALLVGALYGELDSDERARLDSHLATHPADRTALEGLRSTRALLRDSGASAAWGNAEPSAVISAKLLQEAARRAPSPLVATGVIGFLATLFRPIGRHPALSAAAALVVVIGAGRLMMRDGKLETAEPTMSAPSFRDPTGAAPAPALAAPGSGSAADGYRVGFEEGAPAVEGDLDHSERERAARDQREPLEGKLDSTGRGSAAVSGAKRAGESKDTAATKPAAKPTTASEFLAIDKGSPASELALKSPDADGVLDEANRFDMAATATQGNTRAQLGAGTGAPSGGVTIAGRAPQGGDSMRRDAPATGGSAGQAAPVARAPVAPPSSAPPPARVAPSPDPGAATDSLKKEAGVDAWARDQHARMVKLVNSGKCTEVGQIGAEIARRAPEYYQSAVANDRALRSCQAYVDRARRARAVAPAKSKAGNSSPAERQQDEVVK